MKIALIRKALLAASLITLPGISSAQTSVDFGAVRLNNGNPIIEQDMFADLGVSDEGNNINGPSLIRIPNWIRTQDRVDPSAVYYLYFGNHTGDYIRMAWASDLTGPWTLYQTGSNVSVGDRGVLDNGGQDINLGRGIVIEENHLASPDVHVDNENQRIIMYFHSGSSTLFNGNESNGQVSWVSTSFDGLEFRDNIEPVTFGPSYFRVFEDRGELYALNNSGTPRRALDVDDPWEPTSNYYSGSTLPTLWESLGDSPSGDAIRENTGLARSDLRVRHSAVRIVGDELQVFYSQRGDSPERIMVSTIDLDVPSWRDWEFSYPPVTLLTAVSGWEGGQFTPTPSESGAAPGNVNQLRDPYVFEDTDGRDYLLYTGRGESGIGIAELRDTGGGPDDNDNDDETGGGTAGEFPDPSREYFIDNDRWNARLAADGNDNDPFMTSQSNTGDDVRWRFISNGEGLWHIQRSDGGSRPRLRSDSTINADMQGSNSDGTRTAFSFQSVGTDTYLFTLPSVDSDEVDFSRLQVSRDLDVRMVNPSFDGNWTQFRITDAGAL